MVAPVFRLAKKGHAMNAPTAPQSPTRRHHIVLDAGRGTTLLDVLERVYDTAYVDTTKVRFVEKRPRKKYTWALDMRSSLTRGELLRPIAEAMVADVLDSRGIEQIVGYGFGAYPLLGAIAGVRSGINFGMLRPEPKIDGFCKLLEGSLDAASPVAVVDDLVNGGRTLRRTVATMRSLGYRVELACCVFQFEWGKARQDPGQLGVDVAPLATLRRRGS
jgi:orotate phosphoribosyltransferase